jgi:hypothetical protein
MKKIITACVLCLGLIVVTMPSHAEVLVNHHQQPFQGSHAQKKFLHNSAHHHKHQHHPQHRHGHYAKRSHKQKVGTGCLRKKQGRYYRVC